MEETGVVPDVIDKVPKNRIEVRYPNGVEVKFGNELTPLSVKDEPSVKWSVEEGQYYTLIMCDPDAPSRVDPSFGEIKHWLVVNVPGNDLSKGETLAGYRGSLPPEGSGMHRYIFLAYKQPGHLKHSETPVDPNRREDRRHFKAREFSKKYNLGEPIAGNFFLAQNDEYARQLWAKIRSMEASKK